MRERESKDTKETVVTLEDIKRKVQSVVLADIEVLKKAGKIGGGVLGEIIGKEVYQKMLELMTEATDTDASIRVPVKGSAGEYILGGVKVIWVKHPEMEENLLVLHSPPTEENSIRFSLPTSESMVQTKLFSIWGSSFPGRSRAFEVRVQVDAEMQIRGFYFSFEEEVIKNLEKGILTERRKINGEYTIKP